MGGIIPEEVVENVRQQVEIVDLVGEYVRLDKKGRNYVGLCPFHQDKDPSFTVNREKQIFHCFGCGAGGNVFKFIMLAENLTFPEAVRRLARRVGVMLPDTENPREKARARREEKAWQINGMVRDFYRRLLLQNPSVEEARNYLKGRGLTPEIQELFKLGYAPVHWDALIRFMESRQCPASHLVTLGLAVDGERRPYDRFRNRIIFPINNALGRVVGFGGRLLDNGQPKYLNTPETPFFNKRLVLYGLDLARTAIREQGAAVIMEGYMDVVTAHQFGITNAVASLGTSLTTEQGKLLLRYTRDVIIAYDADAAGVAATIRGLDLLQELGCRVRVVTVPDGKDPDEFIRRHGIEGWQGLLARAETLLEYKLRQAGRKTDNAAEILRFIMPNIDALQSNVEREQSIRLAAKHLNLRWEDIRGELKSFQASSRKKWPNPDKIAKNKHNIIKSTFNSNNGMDVRIRAERSLLRLILDEPELLSMVQQELGQDFMTDPSHRQIFRLLCESNAASPAQWMNSLDETAQQVLSGLLVEKIPGEEPVKIIKDLVSSIKKFITQQRKTQLLQELAQAEKDRDQEHVAQLLHELQKLL